MWLLVSYSQENPWAGIVPECELPCWWCPKIFWSLIKSSLKNSEEWISFSVNCLFLENWILQIPTGTWLFKCCCSITMVWSFRCSSADGWKLPQLLNLFSLALATARALSGISWVYPPQAILQQSPPGWLKNMFWPVDSYRPSFVTVDPIDKSSCNISFFHLVINSLVGLGPCGFWNCSIHLCNALILRCFSD